MRSGPEDHPSVVPIDLPTLTSLPQFGGDYRRSMLWGTYRPGLYFGVHVCISGRGMDMHSPHSHQHALECWLALMTGFLFEDKVRIVCEANTRFCCTSFQVCACGCRSRCWRA